MAAQPPTALHLFLWHLLYDPVITLQVSLYKHVEMHEVEELQNDLHSAEGRKMNKNDHGPDCVWAEKKSVVEFNPAATNDNAVPALSKYTVEKKTTVGNTESKDM